MPNSTDSLDGPAQRGQLVFLVGFMGSGKSSVGRALARRLGCEFLDLDREIEQQAGRSVAAIFGEIGESGFRKLEQEELRRLLSDPAAARVVALGGGAFAQPENAAAIRNTGVLTIFLDAPAESMWRRCQEDPQDRPMRGTYRQFSELYRKRTEHYSQANWRIDSSQKTAEEIAKELADQLTGESPAKERSG